MTTFTRTWTCSWNNVPAQTTLDAQAKAVLFAFKSNYVSAGWTVAGSSDSSTAGMDGVDRWASAANLVWAAAGAAHSWIVLKSPNGYLPNSKFVYALFGCSTGASSQNLFNGGWASATYTGGSTTADPTAPANARAFANRGLLTSPVTNSKYHCLRNTTGDVINLCSVDGSGVAQHCNASLQTQPSAETSDNYPWLGLMSFSAGADAFTVGASISSSYSATFWTDGTLITTGGIASINSVTTTTLMSAFTSSGSNLTGTYPRLPAILNSTTSSKVAIRGLLVDVWLGPTGASVTSGVVEPASGSSTTALVGEFWVPNGNVVPSF